jgi:hypothetical protein
MRQYRTVALAGAVTVVAAAGVLLSNGGEKSPTAPVVAGVSETSGPPQVEVVPGTGSVSIKMAQTSRSVGTVAPPEPDRTPSRSAGLPGAKQASGYELAKPGDRTPAPPPDFFRQLNGSFDNSKGPPLFASHCPYSHSRPDDPIVFPRQPGGSHLHDFFGNRSTDAYSTDDSLRKAGHSTCSFPGDSAAYWTPAVYEDGFLVKPASLNAYYTAGTKEPRTIEPFPRGLKMLVKDDRATMWYCAGDHANATYSKEPPRCPVDQHLGLQIVFPDCWDGKYLDVPDHRAHLAYTDRMMCPASHPVPVVQLVLFLDYMSSRGGDIILAPKADPSSPHADFVNSWDQAMLTKFVRDCINSGVHCGGTPPA